MTHTEPHSKDDFVRPPMIGERVFNGDILFEVVNVTWFPAGHYALELKQWKPKLLSRIFGI